MATTVYPTIQKTLTKTIVNYSFLKEQEDGSFKPEPQERLVIDKKKSHNKLTQELGREFPNEIVVINSVEEEKTRYEMNVDDFIKNATATVVVEDQEKED